MPETSSADNAGGRPVRLALVQNAGTGDDPAKTLADLVATADKTLTEEPADFLAFSEMAATAYFCGTNDRRYFDWADTVPGRATEEFGKLARKHSTHIWIPLFERGPRSGVYYNSAVLIGPDGEIIPGTLPDGTQVSAYRKNHLSDNYNADPGTNEKFFFRPGPGFPVFDTEFGRVGALICYDRSFPESWRMLALHGVELVFVFVAIFLRHRAKTWDFELRSAAVQNGFHVAAINKGGLEVVEAERLFSGRSLVIEPFGSVVAEAPADTGDVVLRHTIDLSEGDRHGHRYHYLRDRRPEIYRTLTTVTHV
ncbi:carbon-nitrogen hydrolase family protein [Actinophytocola sp.]|uniref:carbon-nitrogen hydrolase family protein n=1 Tax=Actinophytocola sp. TaxID=1872138 RepID=UPI003D6C3436